MKQVLSDKSKKTFLKIFSYILLFIICYGVSNAKIYSGSLMPFGVGLIFSLFALRYNGYILAIIFFFAYVLAGFSINSIYVALNVCAMLCLLQYLFDSKKVKTKRWIIFLFEIISQIVFIILNLGDSKQNLALLVSIVLGVLFLYSCLSFFDGISKKASIGNLSIDEKICGSVILLLFTFGMSSTNIGFINLGLLFSSLLILILTYMTASGNMILVSSIMGVAYSLQMLNPMFISIFVVMSLMSICFKSSLRVLSGVSLLLGYIIFTFVFNLGFSYGEILSVAIGCILFLCIPIGYLTKICRINNNKYNVIAKNFIKNAKKQIIKRVEELAKVFDEMNGVYKGMVRGVLPDDKAVDLLKEELISSVCGKCKNRDMCFRARGNFLENSFDTIVATAYEKGKVLLIDLPEYLSSNCSNVNGLINVLNNMTASYKDYAGAVSNLDTSRILIADQLSGVSKLLGSLAKEVDINVDFDGTFDERIKEDLSCKNIVCLDCTIYQKDIQSKSVNLIVKTDTIDKKEIEKIVSKITNSHLKISSIEPSDISGSSVVMLETMPNYDVAFGCSSVNKTGKVVSGDSRSLIKIDDGKFMVSICDGMGSGKDAHNISALTISLIEKFYLAGFDNDTILNSVNKLLSLSEQENFSTIDLCIIDAKKNTYDFIKLGATSGYLKREKGECEVIESSGLPVGVLEEVRPHITKKLINPFDMLVFVSDGVTDSFSGKIDLAKYISSLDIINPLSLSKEILDKALDLDSGIAKDDMTVVCVRVFNNY